MFGRRRRAARAAEARETELRALQLGAPQYEPSALLAPAQLTVDLTGDAVTALLHRHLTDLIGADGVWTLVPRRSDDTEVFFHELKAHEIARTLSAALCEATRSTPTTTATPATPATAMLREVGPETRDAAPAAARGVSTSTLTTPITEPAEPTALPWTPRPVAHWTDPASASPRTAPTPAKVSHRPVSRG